MSKINKIILSAAIILIVAALVIIAVLIWQRGDFSRPYYAVYLDTGDLYFGKLSRFPSLTLSDVWYLKGNPSGDLYIEKFDRSIWGPEDKMKINKDKVIWISKISLSSQILSVISGKSPDALPSLNNSSDSVGDSSFAPTSSSSDAVSR